MRDRRLAQTIYETNEKIRTSAAKSQAYVMHGPSYSSDGEEKTYRDLVEVWKRCSVQMKYLCDGNRIKYFHFLQPNQYVDGSKPMSAAEQRQALNEKSPYKHAVARGYPILAQAGRELQSAGVNFTDLTMIYSTHEGLLYVDDCCHTNTEGADIVARRIYETIQSQP
jgi:endonuclease IV